VSSRLDDVELVSAVAGEILQAEPLPDLEEYDRYIERVKRAQSFQQPASVG
jgi:hypothetical protein